jgi:hypothetical protein
MSTAIVSGRQPLEQGLARAQQLTAEGQVLVQKLAERAARLRTVLEESKQLGYNGGRSDEECLAALEKQLESCKAAFKMGG